MVRRTPGGLRVIPCPFAIREAQRAVVEAGVEVVRSIAGDGRVVIDDHGRSVAQRVDPPGLTGDLLVVVHRQETASPRAAAVRLERLAESVALVSRMRRASGDTAPVLVVVGGRP